MQNPLLDQGKLGREQRKAPCRFLFHMVIFFRVAVIIAENEQISVTVFVTFAGRVYGKKPNRTIIR